MLSCLGGSRKKRPPKQNPLRGKPCANSNIDQSQRPLQNIQHHYQQPCLPRQSPYLQHFTTAQDAAHTVTNPQHHLPIVRNLAGPQKPTLVQKAASCLSPSLPMTAAHTAQRVPEQQRQWKTPMIYPADGSRTALPRNACTPSRQVRRRPENSTPSLVNRNGSSSSGSVITRPPATARSRAMQRSSVRSSTFSLCKNMTGLLGHGLGHFSPEELVGEVVARPAPDRRTRRNRSRSTTTSKNRGSMFSLCKNLTGFPGSELGVVTSGYRNLDQQRSEASHGSGPDSLRRRRAGSEAVERLVARKEPDTSTRTPPRRPSRPDEHITHASIRARTGAASDTDARGPSPSPGPTTVTTTTTTTTITTTTSSVPNPTSIRVTGSPPPITTTTHLRHLLLPLRVSASAHNEQLYSSRVTQEQARQRLEGSGAPYRHGDENAGFWNNPPAGTAAAAETSARRAEDRTTLWPTMPTRPSSPSASSLPPPGQQQRQGQGDGLRFQQQKRPPLTGQSLHAAHYAVSSSYANQNEYPCYRNGSEQDGYESSLHCPTKIDPAVGGRQWPGMDLNGVSPCSSPAGDHEDGCSGKSWRESHAASPSSCMTRSSSVYST